MFEELITLVRQFDRIIIHRHTNPDGDAIGSQIGLKMILSENFPEKEIYAVGDPAGRYDFIPGSVMDTVPNDAYADALAIVLDTSAKSLINDGRYETAKATIRIDHHLFVEKICETEIVDTSFESCAGMIAAFAEEQKMALSSTAAQVIFTGMVTDSGRFRYDSTTSRTFRLASFLCEKNFSLSEVYNGLYVEDFDMIRLRASFTVRIAFTEKRNAYIYTTKEEFDALGLDSFTVSRGMVNTMSGIRGVDNWVNFTETDAGVLCEIRSAKYNINPIAVKYGGGGHAKASGATLKNREEAMALLADLDALCEEANA